MYYKDDKENYTIIEDVSNKKIDTPYTTTQVSYTWVLWFISILLVIAVGFIIFKQKKTKSNINSRFII